MTGAVVDARRAPLLAWRRTPGDGIAGHVDPVDRFADLPAPAIGAVVGLCYLALAQYVIWLNDPVNAGAGYWPAAGITVVALLILPVSRWGWVIAAVALAEIGGDALHGYPLAASSWWAAGNIAGPVTGALLLRRFGMGGRLSPLAPLLRFLALGVVVGPALGAIVGSVGTASTYDMSYEDVVLKWWVGDGLGVLVVAPVLLCLRERSLSRRRRWEPTATVLAVALITMLTFRDWHREWDVVLPYLILPAMMLTSVRLGIRGAAMTGLVVAELANLATALGYGPFEGILDAELDSVTVLQVFLATSLTAAMVIAVLTQSASETTLRSERHRAVADAFQIAALPEHLPRVNGLSLGATYVAAGDGGALHVGGDWYDAFTLDDGATAFVVGDVAGHDLSAAVVMGQVRNGLRSLLTELRDPCRAMAAMDRQLAQSSELTLVTAILGVYADGELVWTNAGHPPPLLVPERGHPHYLTPRPNRLLGMGETHYDEHRTRLDVGDVIVAYTDGVMEHRARSLTASFERLEHVLRTATTREPQALCDLLVEKGLSGFTRSDDACVLALRRVNASPT